LTASKVRSRAPNQVVVVRRVSAVRVECQDWTLLGGRRQLLRLLGVDVRSCNRQRSHCGWRRLFPRRGAKVGSMPTPERAAAAMGCSLLNDAETSRGPWTAATLAGSESLGEVATPTSTPCVSPGATIGRFLAAGDRVLAPARHLLEHRSRALAPLEVFGAALGTSNSSRSAYGASRPR
jgi:hypothetical protein